MSLRSPADCTQVQTDSRVPDSQTDSQVLPKGTPVESS